MLKLPLLSNAAYAVASVSCLPPLLPRSPPLMPLTCSCPPPRSCPSLAHAPRLPVPLPCPPPSQELWCKKGAPTAELIATYNTQPPLPLRPPSPPPRGDMHKLALLTGLADKCGRLLQNQHQVWGWGRCGGAGVKGMGAEGA